MALKDIQIPKIEVPVGLDSSFAVRGLSTSDLQHLVHLHGDSMRGLFTEFVNGKATKLDKLEIMPILNELLKRAPVLVQDIISLAADAADDEERAIVGKLPASSQMSALGSVFTLTLSTDGDMGNGLEAITQLIGGLNEAMGEKLQVMANS